MVQAIRLLLFSTAFFVGFVACKPSEKEIQTVPIVVQNNNGGVQDWGTGEILRSTEAEVHLAIQQARIQFSEPIYLGNQSLFGALVYGIYSNKTEAKEYKLILAIQEENPAEILKSANFSMDMKDCPRAGNHKHAAVSKFSKDATICLNIPELMKLPSASLYRELIGLLAHEVAHMLGHDEDAAVLVQQTVKNAWPVFEKSISASHYLAIKDNYLRILSDWNNASGWFHKGKSVEKAAFSVGASYAALISFNREIEMLNADLRFTGFNQEILRKLKAQNFQLETQWRRFYLNSEPKIEEQILKAEASFCQMAQSYFEMMDSLYVFDEKVDFHKEKLIQIQSEEIVISCENVAKELFDNTRFLNARKRGFR